MMLLLTLAAAVAAEYGYMVLGALYPALSVGQTLMLATGLHLLAHRVICRHMTPASAAEVVGAALSVDLAVHLLQLHGNWPRTALHLALVVAIHLVRQRRRRR